MASMTKDKNGSYKIQLHGDDRKRHTIRLGKVSKSSAIQSKHHVEELVSARLGRTPADQATSRWVGEAPDKLADALYRAGLIRQRQKRAVMTVGGFAEWFIDFKAIKNPNTIKNYVQVCRILGRHFGVATSMDLITAGEAETMMAALRKRYAPATVARLTKFFKQFWKVGIRAGFARENPFESFVAGPCTNAGRIRFIGRDDIERILAACPDAEWQTLVALARYGGLRIPSEIRVLRWDDVQWVQRRIVINSSKTGRREIPLYDEIHDPLKRLADETPEDTVHVFRHSRRTAGNLRTSFQRIINRAGVKPWPRLWHNLRASCGMELADKVAPHVYGAIMGHTATVALQHYLKVRTEDFEKLVQKPTLRNAELNGSTPAQIVHTQSGAPNNPVLPLIAAESDERKYTPQDTVLTRYSLELSDTRSQIGAESEAFPDLAAVVTAWPRLSPAARAEIVRLADG